jgi:predicted dienelactone hydrolase
MLPHALASSAPPRHRRPGPPGRAAMILALFALGLLLLPALARPAAPPTAASPSPSPPALPPVAGAAPAKTPRPPRPIPYKPGPGPHEVGRAHYDWVDEARHRPVPVTVYSPKGGEGPFPVIVFSHGLGGSRDGYGYLGRYWASYGYVVVHVQHLGSDDSIWQDRDKEKVGKAVQKALANPRTALDRPADVRFVLDRLEVLNRDEPALKGRLDLERTGMAGHSFGAWTTLAVAGQLAIAPSGRELSFVDRRIKAALSMSAPVPRRKEQHAFVFRGIKIPCFHMTGTKDDSPVGETSAGERRIPFDHIDGADQYLVTFKGGDHRVFSGRPREARGGEKDGQFQELIKMGSIAFWDAYLKGEVEARAWLSRGGFAGVLGEEGVFEKKLKE